MAPVNQFEGEYAYLKQNTSSEQSKSHQLSLRNITTNVYQLGLPTKTDGACGGLPCSEEGRHSRLDIILLSQWEDHAWKGHLRYDVSSCQMKVITGGKKFIAQLNENWSSNILMDLEKKIFQSLSPIRSSYMKTHMEDVLFCVSCGEKEGSELVYSAVLPKDGILIFANANPVEYGHIFLVPYDVHQMPQFLDKGVLGLMSQITAEVANRSFHIFFDYDASRSLDHKCFQACYFADPLPVELLPTIAVYGNLLTTGVYIGEVAEYPLKTLVFISKNLKALVETVGETCCYLHDNGTAFSLLISDCGTRIFLFPQVCKLLGYHLSAWECGGFFVYDAKSDFDDVTELSSYFEFSLRCGATRTGSLDCCCCSFVYPIFGSSYNQLHTRGPSSDLRLQILHKSPTRIALQGPPPAIDCRSWNAGSFTEFFVPPLVAVELLALLMRPAPHSLSQAEKSSLPFFLGSKIFCSPSKSRLLFMPVTRIFRKAAVFML
ncbi:hypothetical protein OPV22_004348 [Ensete ventricosum]|uniref:HIT domain-containing protein n=1 Tax=Ensete ventricosum TaxID=4639 RepID=A0AAV8S3K1_ENSVE|nr:hypothetical protein OPV22_004348 [Ensete ventricosum]